MDWQKTAAAVAIGIGLVGAGVVGGIALDKPQTIVEKVPVPFTVEKVVEKEVPVDRIVEVEKIVEVEDEEFLKLACDKLMYEDIMECKEEITAEDAALKKALKVFEDQADIFDLLEDEGLIVDEDEAKLIKVYDDMDDIVIVESDFDDEEYEFQVTARFEDKELDEKFKAVFNIVVDEDGVEIKEVALV